MITFWLRSSGNRFLAGGNIVFMLLFILKYYFLLLYLLVKLFKYEGMHRPLLEPTNVMYTLFSQA